MHLVEILLPLTDDGGKAFALNTYENILKDLTDRFGGVTAFNRAPADGISKEGGKVTRDNIVVFEVMTEHLDRAWWEAYRRKLEQSFRQDEILIRATAITKL